MRNGQTIDPVKAAEAALDDGVNSLDQITLKKPGTTNTKSAEPATATKEDSFEEFGATSFSFEVERTVQKPAPTERIQTIKKFDAQRTTPDRAREPSVAKNSTARTHSSQTRVPSASKSGGRGGSLLDRYISFIAKMLKALEKFILRRFNRGQVENQRTQESAETAETTATAVDKPKKKVPVVRGPGI